MLQTWSSGTLVYSGVCVNGGKLFAQLSGSIHHSEAHTSWMYPPKETHVTRPKGRCKNDSPKLETHMSEASEQAHKVRPHYEVTDRRKENGQDRRPRGTQLTKGHVLCGPCM